MQARTERISGKVVLSAMIGADGSVGEIAVVSGSPILAEAAKEGSALALSSRNAERQPDRDPEADHVSVHPAVRMP